MKGKLFPKRLLISDDKLTQSNSLSIASESPRRYSQGFIELM